MLPQQCLFSSHRLEGVINITDVYIKFPNCFQKNGTFIKIYWLQYKFYFTRLNEHFNIAIWNYFTDFIKYSLLNPFLKLLTQKTKNIIFRYNYVFTNFTDHGGWIWNAYMRNIWCNELFIYCIHNNYQLSSTHHTSYRFLWG